MSIFKSESFRDEMFVGEAETRRRSIFMAVQELNGLIHDEEIDRERIREIIIELEQAQDRLSNQILIEAEDQERIAGDILTIRNTLTQPRLAEIMIGEE